MKRLWAVLAICASLAMLRPPPATAASSSSFNWLFTGYLGSPSPPTTPTAGGAFVATSGVVTIAKDDLVSIKIEDTESAGIDGVGTVQVQTRDCPTCGWYIQQTCTNPPASDTASTRCDYTLADAYQVKLVVTAFTDGTYRANIRTKVF